MTYLRYGEFNFGINVHVIAFRRDDFGEMEKDSCIPLGAADKTVAFLDSGHDSRLALFSRHHERLLEEFDVGSPFQFVTPINGYIELDPVSMSARQK